MSDRELLELAALAAGIGPVLGQGPTGLLIGPHSRPRVFNSLLEDRDAFNLIVVLNLEVERSLGGGRFYVGRFGEGKWMEDAKDHDSRSLAFRYAVTRAAAEIGKAMQEGR